MNMIRAIGLALLAATAAEGADTAGEMPLLGHVKTRHASEIAASTWTIGSETLDREYALYANYRDYMGPLGAKRARLQAGWAKCEKTPGVYDWAWLDEVIEDLPRQGIKPWVQTSYGNPAYPGGGGMTLNAGLPTSPEALAAWDNWVRALVQRYGQHVNEWEVWNEPDGNKSITPEAYAALFIRTAKIIRAEQPEARIHGLSLAGFAFAEPFLIALRDAGEMHLLDAVTVHGYPHNPDETGNVDKMRALLKQYNSPAEVQQGETGSPSRWQPVFALSKMDWSENRQAKWNLRRMLAHHGKDVPFSMYCIIDQHSFRDGQAYMNYKGLLATNEDKTVSHAKPSYYAAQRVFTIFDASAKRLREFSFTASQEGLAGFAWQREATGGAIVAMWNRSAPPADQNKAVATTLDLPGVRFTEPVYVDLLSGEVRSIPKAQWSTTDSGARFIDIPVGDWPVLIAERDALEVAP